MKCRIPRKPDEALCEGEAVYHVIRGLTTDLPIRAEFRCTSCSGRADAPLLTDEEFAEYKALKEARD